MNPEKAHPNSRLKKFINSLQDADIPRPTQPNPKDKDVFAFCKSDSKRPEFKGEYVEPVGFIPKKGPLRFQSRRRDILWHFIATGRTTVHLRTANSLAVVSFPEENSYKALSDQGSFQTYRMKSMTGRQLAIARKETGNGSLDAFNTTEHSLASWPDSRIKVALDYASWCRDKRKGSTDRNVRNFLIGGPCKNLIYFMAFRQMNDPIAPVLVYIGQTTQTFAERMGDHFKAHATLVDLLCMTTPEENVISFVLDVSGPDDDLDTLEYEAIAVFGGVSPTGANMVHGRVKK